MSESGSHILVSQAAGIYKIVLNRPDKKHALTHAMYTDLRVAIEAAEADRAIRVIYLTGSAGCFTSGNDMKDFLSNPPSGEDAPVFQLLNVLVNATKPIVAAVSGPAVGIGTTMLMHCDLVYCDNTARFRLPFVSLGLCPEAGSSLLLPLLAGYHKAAEMLLLGEAFGASTARRIGLVNAILSQDDLQATALERATQLAAQPAASVRLTKALMKRSLQFMVPELMAQESEHFIDRLQSPEAREAIGAFMEKRKPDFSRFD
jgi:enoyl-CoA hydratase/carnithine racemase